LKGLEHDQVVPLVRGAHECAPVVLPEADAGAVEEVPVRLPEPLLRERDDTWIQLDAVELLEPVGRDGRERLSGPERDPERALRTYDEQRGDMAEEF
jgi:hypothetical protein